MNMKILSAFKLDPHSQLDETIVVLDEETGFQRIFASPVEVWSLGGNIDMWFEMYGNSKVNNLIVHNQIVKGTVYFTGRDQNGEPIALTSVQKQAVTAQLIRSTDFPLPIYLDVLNVDSLNNLQKRYDQVEEAMGVLQSGY